MKGHTTMKIAGIQKLSLLDYPDKTCATIFTAGCNFRCPFCHNSRLVLTPAEAEEVSEDEIFAFLKKRQGLLDGVCITGGEPLLQAGIEDFIKKVRGLGFEVKLDTNGYFPDRLASLLASGTVDFVAMDIKNSLPKYAETSGLSSLDTSIIEKSIAVIKESGVPYEFRTTLVREFHTREDIIEIAHLLSGAKRYALQSFRDSGEVIRDGLSAYSDEEIWAFADDIKPFFGEVIIKG